MRSRRFLIYCVILGTATILIHGLTLRPGHTWDGDYGLYIMQARNIVDGLPYRQVEYLPNPTNPIHPALYPAGLPLLLAPVYAVFGVNLDAMKWVNVIGFGLFVLVFAYIAALYLPHWLALGVAALMATHPYIWWFKEIILSELPFLFFTYATLGLGYALLEADYPRSWRVPLVVLLTLALTMAVLTRSVGVVLFPVLLVSSLWRLRRVPAEFIVTVAVASGMLAAAQVWLPSDAGTYLRSANALSVTHIQGAARDYFVSANHLLQPGAIRSIPLQWFATALFLGIAALGATSRLRLRVTIFEIFAGAYLCAMFISPWHNEFDRYALPLWPLTLLYFVVGSRWLIERSPLRGKREALAGLIVLVLFLPTVRAVTRLETGPLEFSVTSEPSRRLFAAIEAAVPPQRAIITSKPTIIGLFAHRKASIWTTPFTANGFWSHARTMHASHLLQMKDVYHFDADTTIPLGSFVAEYRECFNKVFENEWFNLYRMRVPFDGAKRCD